MERFEEREILFLTLKKQYIQCELPVDSPTWQRPEVSPQDLRGIPY
jgi:hypothetical protein